MKILVLNGPNLGRLDLRDSAIYGDLDFAGLSAFIFASGKELGFECDVVFSRFSRLLIFIVIIFCDVNAAIF
jgi:3-dehydroquinate dehydratase